MARSRYIYVVTNSSSIPVAAFTVKHECVAWLEEREDWERLEVERFSDGAKAVPKSYTARQFLEGDA